MKCKIKMTGSTGEYSAVGELTTFSDGLEIQYKLFDDLCFLHYSCGILTHSRKGQLNLNMTFREGHKTTCHLGEGENLGSFVVFSDIVQVKILNNGVKIKLSYLSEGERVELNFVAMRQD